MSTYLEPLYWPFKQDLLCLPFIIWTRQNCEWDEVDNFCLHLLYLLFLFPLELKLQVLNCVPSIYFSTYLPSIHSTAGIKATKINETIPDFQELSP